MSDNRVKLNRSNTEKSDFDVIPDIPSTDAVSTRTSAPSGSGKSYVKESEEPQGRKMFANKKANIALAIVGGVIILGIIAAAIFVNVPVA